MSNNYNTQLQSNNTDLQAILNAINELPEAGGDIALPELTNEGSASDLLAGKEFIDGDGNVVIGTLPTVNQATPSVTIDSNGLITANATQTAGYVAAGTRSATKQLAFQPAKTITPRATSQVAVAGGYYTGGDITVVGDENLKAENIKSGTSIFGVNGIYEGSSSEVSLQDKTITLNGTHTADDGYDGLGTVTVNVPTEMDYTVEDAFVTGTLTTYTNNRVTLIGNNAFCNYSKLSNVNFPACTSIGSEAFSRCYGLANVSFPACVLIGSNAFYCCTSLTSINFPVCTTMKNAAFYCCSSIANASFPVCTSIGSNAFYYCSRLANVSFPACISIGSNAFYRCNSLTSINFPVCTSIGSGAFYSCSKLANVSFPACISIGNEAFSRCFNLVSFYLTGSTVCALSNSNAFTSTPIGGYSISAGKYGSIFVPASLLTSYQTATNWAYFSSRFVGI